MCLEYYLETHKNIYFLIKCAIFQEKPRQLHNLYTLNLFILFFFLIWLHQVLVVVCGISFPEQVPNWALCTGSAKA